MPSVNEYLRDILKFTKSGGGTFQKVRTTQYELDSPTLNAEIDSGFDLSVLDDNAEITVIAIVNITSSGNAYALFSRVDALTLNANKDIRISRTSEFEGAGGDVALFFWVDSATNTLHYEIDSDGQGKTVTAAVISTIEYEFV